MSAKERKLLKSQESLVVARKLIVTKVAEYICIAPYLRATKMQKEFKEKMRRLKIEPKLRGYLAEDAEAEAFLSLLLA